MTATKTQHTPGPWEIDFTMHGALAVRSKASFVATACRDTQYEQANAYLLAAAPELLDACEWLVKMCEANGYALDNPKLHAARTAIAKAKGE